jgi:uncharacterized circularly permuted ATP-grasp superfamily protein/uncharacterized alpha-E superfamily protein
MTSATGIPVDVPGGLAQSYVPALPDRDEMCEPDGALRPHWQPFVSMMDDLGWREIHQRWDHARRLIRDNGITHNIYGDPNGVARPWSLDLLPLLLPAEDWQAVGRGLAQRARLLNALTADLYGPATCVSNGLLPPELVYANPRFLRPAHGVLPPQGIWLHVYAADLVRRSANRFQVLSDRAQAPSGAGYCLENRIVLTRALPTVFRRCLVLRLAPFFIALRKTLASLAPAHRENPRVVLLTPGPYNETYFEHAYLARYLGYTLVQGNDLTVRDGSVFLKTLSGLQRVDTILRRVDDDFCDPLELYYNSFLGVPGLMQAIRDKTVAVANAIGSGLAQATAYLPFLPSLCRHFLAEDLQIESVPTWWCGRPDDLPAMPMTSTDPVFCAHLTRDQLSDLADKIRARPADYVGQELLASFTAPVLLDNQPQSRQLLVRAFLTAADGGYEVMPGGLTRVSASPDSMIVSLQKGGGSKDTWILSDAPVSGVALLPSPAQSVELNRGGGDLPSRVADDLFWLGRYIQRAEATVRLARCVFNRLSDPNASENPRAVDRLMRKLFGSSAALAGRQAIARAGQLFASNDPSNLSWAVHRFYSLARVLRDRISLDAWRILSQIEQDISSFDGQIGDDQIDDVLVLLNKLVTGFLAFSGMASDSMTRGQPWRFLDMGLRIERALSATQLIRTTLVDAFGDDEAFVLDALLEIADSAMTYRRRYLTQLQAPAVLDLLVADEGNPRAVAYQIAALVEHLSNLPHDPTHPRRNPDLQSAMQLRTMLRLADLGAICKPAQGRRPALDKTLGEIIFSLMSISEQVTRTYFSHAAAKVHGAGEPEGQE